MDSIQKFGFLLIFLSLLGIIYVSSPKNIIVEGYTMAFKSYPMSIKSANEKISPTLKQIVSRAKPDANVPVVLKLTGPSSMSISQQQLVISQLQAYGFQPLMTVNYLGNMVAGTVPAKNIDEVASNPYVDQVLADIVVAQVFDSPWEINFLRHSVPYIRADKVWEQGYTGQGVTVIVIDTGIVNNHPYLIRDGKSLVIDEKIIVPNVVDYAAPQSHGTHVAGIVASQDSTFRGVAPGIKGFVDIVAFSPNGTAKLSWMLAALDYAYSVADKYWPAVSTNSWGGPARDTPEYNELRNAALKLAEKIPVVFAAGNYGYTSAGSIATPADADRLVNGELLEIITVGAVDNTGEYAKFSSTGPDRYGTDHNEPDVVAPGVGITSLKAPTGLTQMSGTSMATPHVAGVIALMLSKNPSLSNMEVLNILTKTADDLRTDGFDYFTGYGVVRADKAIQATPSKPIPLPSATIAITEVAKYVFMATTVLGLFMAITPSTFRVVVERW